MKERLLVLPLAWALAVSGHPGPSAPQVTDAALAEARATMATLLDPILTDSALRRARLGVHVVRVADGAELYSRDADALLIPASNVKVITTAAALRVMGPDYQFPTEIFGQLAPGGEVRGDLVVKGYGDPYLVPERVWFLATRLYFLGLRTITGDLVVDDSYFEGPRLAMGWEQDRTAAAYMAPAGAFSVGFNAMLVHILPAATVGQEARVLLDPASTYATVEGKVQTGPRGRSSISVDLTPEGDRDIIKIAGSVAISDGGRAYWRRVSNPPLYAGEVLRGALAQVGVALRGKVRVGQAPTQVPKLLDYASSRLADLINPLNKYSNNFMAAQVAYAMGAKRFGPPGTWDKGRRAIEDFLTEDVLIPRGSYSLNNASGLHDVNRVSPRQMVRILDFMQRQPQLFPEFLASLAVAGGSGTLQERMLETQAAHVLRAKTGTLSSASALSGYVTVKSGETLAFSIIVNGYQHIESVWSAQDRLGSTLANLSFAPPAREEATRAATQTAEDSRHP